MQPEDAAAIPKKPLSSQKKTQTAKKMNPFPLNIWCKQHKVQLVNNKKANSLQLDNKSTKVQLVNNNKKCNLSTTTIQGATCQQHKVKFHYSNTLATLMIWIRIRIRVRLWPPQ
jgi:hypothetical protein